MARLRALLYWGAVLFAAGVAFGVGRGLGEAMLKALM